MEDYQTEQAKVRVRPVEDITDVTILEPVLGPPTMIQFLMDYPTRRLTKWTS